jgi:hypothetical protein
MHIANLPDRDGPRVINFELAAIIHGTEPGLNNGVLIIHKET